MKNIILTDGSTCLVDDEDYDYLSKYTWYNIKGYARSSKMKQGKTTNIAIHRLITNCPKGKVVDHINRNPLDNRKCNLRICTQKGNIANSKIFSNNTTGYKGVSFNKKQKTYLSHINVDQRQLYLGNFETAEDAANAYNNAAILYFKEFARLNILPENMKFKEAINQNKFGHKGVSKIKEYGYMAEISYNGKRHYLGLFKTIEEAAKAYSEAYDKYYLNPNEKDKNEI